MAELIQRWLAFEEGFSSSAVTEWSRNHAELPVAAVALYLLFIFTVPEVLQKPLELKKCFALWNLLLSIFSAVGVSKILPYLFGTLMDRGFRYTVCEPPSNWYAKGPAGVWMMLFIYSKFPELGDTAFLVLRKKPVIFLHWFHHTTVLLYCWHASVVLAAPGIWFAAMNFSVHSVMYFYFFMTNMGYFKLMQPIAPFITMIQILQMVGGIICLVSVASLQLFEGFEACPVDPANWKMGLMMYASYFVLFGWLFIQKYLPKNNQAIKREKSVLKPSQNVFRALSRHLTKHFHSELSGEESAEEIEAEMASLEEQRQALEQRIIAAKSSNKFN